jgi:acetolactate synthase-1/3 small subunit
MSLSGKSMAIRRVPEQGNGGNGGRTAARSPAGQPTGTVGPGAICWPRHVISLYVSNKPGVLIRVALVFARRGFNIDSLVVSEGHDPAFSHMTITASGDENTLRLILSQLNKLVDVVHAKDHTGEDLVRRELVLIKLRCTPQARSEILQIAQMFKCEAVHLTDTTITLECTGEPEKIDTLHRLLGGFGVLEMVRTGNVLIARGEETTY